MKPLILFAFIASFGTIAFAQKSTNFSVPGDTVVIDSTNHQRMLLGYCNRQSFQDTSFSWWFNSLYDMYEVDSTTAVSFKDKLDNVKITIVMGTWCSDSHKVVPKFLRILDYVKFPQDSTLIIAVGRNLKARGNETEGMDIKSVPTIIFYKNGNEIGRITESPKETLEKDTDNILKG
jgi:hypothetical protein